MVNNDENRGKSRRLGAEDRGDVMCNPHRTRGRDEKRGFPGLASKPMVTVCQWFGHKTTTMVSWFGPQNQG
jgi:hypothetical protein